MAVVVMAVADKSLFISFLGVSFILETKHNILHYSC